MLVFDTTLNLFTRPHVGFLPKQLAPSAGCFVSDRLPCLYLGKGHHNSAVIRPQVGPDQGNGSAPASAAASTAGSVPPTPGGNRPSTTPGGTMSRASSRRNSRQNVGLEEHIDDLERAMFSTKRETEATQQRIQALFVEKMELKAALAALQEGLDGADAVQDPALAAKRRAAEAAEKMAAAADKQAGTTSGASAEEIAAAEAEQIAEQAANDVANGKDRTASGATAASSTATAPAPAASKGRSPPKGKGNAGAKGKRSSGASSQEEEEDPSAALEARQKARAERLAKKKEKQRQETMKLLADSKTGMKKDMEIAQEEVDELKIAIKLEQELEDACIHQVAQESEWKRAADFLNIRLKNCVASAEATLFCSKVAEQLGIEEGGMTSSGNASGTETAGGGGAGHSGVVQGLPAVGATQNLNNVLSATQAAAARPTSAVSQLSAATSATAYSGYSGSSAWTSESALEIQQRMAVSHDMKVTAATHAVEISKLRKLLASVSSGDEHLFVGTKTDAELKDPRQTAYARDPADEIQVSLENGTTVGISRVALAEVVRALNAVVKDEEAEAFAAKAAAEAARLAGQDQEDSSKKKKVGVVAFNNLKGLLQAERMQDAFAVHSARDPDHETTGGDGSNLQVPGGFSPSRSMRDEDGQLDSSVMLDFAKTRMENMGIDAETGKADVAKTARKTLEEKSLEMTEGLREILQRRPNLEQDFHNVSMDQLPGGGHASVNSSFMMGDVLDPEERAAEEARRAAAKKRKGKAKAKSRR